MAQILDPRAAAEAIRGRMKQPKSVDRHVEAFVNQVLDHLGLDHSMSNSLMAAHALHDADIQPHQIVEYPKWVTRDGKDENDQPYEPVLVQDQDEEDAAMRGDAPGVPLAAEYPKVIQVRGTDGHLRPQTVRDLKEEREFLGVNESAIDPEASTQYKKSLLKQPTEDEIGRADAISRGGEQERAAIEQVNRPKAPISGSLRPAARPSNT